jgi:DNA modification methylase
MTPSVHYSDDAVTLWHGDARQVSEFIPANTVDLLITSPPYFALRSYTDAGEHYDGQMGSEATPREFVDNLIAATADWVKVLKPTGSIWVNLGDKYSGSGGHNNSNISRWSEASLQGGKSTLARMDANEAEANRIKATRRQAPDRYNQASDGIPAKSLMGLPWRYANRVVDELGLIMRECIIWQKPNGLPESVTDRCRVSHEYLFHFTRQGRYFAAMDEIRSPSDAAGGASRTLAGGSTLGPERCGTLLADNGPSVARWWGELGPLKAAVRLAVAGNAQRHHVLHPVGFNMRVETVERDYVVHVQSAGANSTVGAPSTIAVENALTNLCPSWTPVRGVPTPPVGVVLASTRYPDAPHRTEDPLLDLVTIAEEGLAARLTLQVDECRATLLVWDSFAAHNALSLSPESSLGKLPGSVWSIPSEPLVVPDHLGVDHFAAFPSELPRRIILGWSPKAYCTACDEPRRAVVARTPMVVTPSARRLVAQESGNASRTSTSGTMTEAATATITGYACACPTNDAPTRPAVVLDPFLGTGTTAAVAKALGRNAIGVDLSRDYLRLAEWRVNDPGIARKVLERSGVRVPKAPVIDGQLDLLDGAA